MSVMRLSKIPLSILGLILLCSLPACYPDETLNVPVNVPVVNLDTDLDRYIDDNFTKEYGMVIRYRFVDNFVSPFQRVAPPRVESVRPMLDFIENFWIEPYMEVENGEAFFREQAPAEVVFLGGLIFNADGTVTLGTADAGAQITFTNVNAIDPDDLDWRALQLQTVYHEFAHVVHQDFNLPAAYETISPQGYTSAGSWFNLTDEEALQRGFVSPYATSSPNEDFAETVAFYLFETNFNEIFLNLEPDCTTPECSERNEGRGRINEKLTSISEHYQKVTGIDLAELRAAVQSKL